MYEAFVVVSVVGDAACACVGEMAVVDGASSVDVVLPSEVSSIGELWLAVKCVGDLASVGSYVALGSVDSCAIVMGIVMWTVETSCSAECV